METSKSKRHFTDVLLFIVFLLLLALPGYLCYEILTEKKTTVQQTSSSDASTTTDSEQLTTTTSTENANNSNTLTDSYLDFAKEISGQTAYIAVPTNIDKNNPPSVILQSHGSGIEVISDMNDPDMLDLQGYGKYFASQNYIFAASNEHGDNWGSTDSVDDMANLRQWIKDHYPTAEKIYLIGHSMGGLPTMHFALQYPDEIAKIALLAPTTRTYEWDQDKVDAIKGIDIQIWHGTADENISIQDSIDFISYMQGLGDTINLVQLPGEDHDDVKTNHKDQILEFFQSN
jgi:dipeptidyl aminopeptidase/acylaminoacyl peptidase